MRKSISPQQDDGLLTDAIAWYMRLQQHTTGEETWKQFTAWLEADSAHRAAFDQVEDLYAELDEATDELVPMIAVPAMSDWAPNVIPLRSSRRQMVRNMVMGAGVLAALLIATIGVKRAYFTDNALFYTTNVSETRTIALPDGSTVNLGPVSKIKVDYTAGHRYVRLEGGEAVFQVIHNDTRPFVVQAADRNIRDVGTVFGVRQYDGRVTVTVAEGMVAVSPQTALENANTVRLAAGDQLQYRQGMQATVLKRVDADAALAWRDGYLTYEDAPLSQVVGDLNRYFHGRISLQSNDDLGKRKFSGVLRVESEDRAVRRLTEILSLTAQRNSDGSIILRPVAHEN